MSANSDNREPVIGGSALALVSLAWASALGYAVLLWLSWRFGTDTPAVERPTIWMLAVFGGLFLAYGLSLRFAIRLPASRRLTIGIFAASCLFRSLLLPSVPMHEIDLYRYIWDGAVLAEGVSPYRYTPEQVLDAVNAGGAPQDATLQRLVELQASSGSLNESLDAIHYGHYPSPYPLVSQAVFAVSALVTPDDATTHSRLVVMKLLLVLMDLATLAVVILLLREVGMHVGWSIAYGWCPLVLKEIANGGHLDSIAIFLTTLAIWLLARSARWRDATRPNVWAGMALALAIGAKLYPVVLVPLFAAVWLRQFGWRAVGAGLTTVGLLSAVLLYPLLRPSVLAEPEVVAQPISEGPDELGQLNEPVPSPQPTVAANDGIKAFLDQWEMNDLLFMIVLENVRPQAEIVAEKKPWFVFTTDAWAKSILTKWASWKGTIESSPQGEGVEALLEPKRYRREAFSLARTITGAGFAIYACLIAWFAAGKRDPRDWCRAAMLTLAWFWLTCPTQNPWYWCWVVPLLPFARRRTWFFVAAVTMLYYLRFWLTANYPEPAVLGTPYNGAYFFYFVVAWIEFVPVFIGLLSEWLWELWKSQRATKH